MFIFSLFLAVAAYHEGKENLLSGANDFAPFYAATTLVGTPDIYNPDKVFGIITRELGEAMPLTDSLECRFTQPFCGL